MTDIELKVAESLRADADRGIKVDGLREGAIARAGTMRWRRRAFTTAAAGGLAAVLTAGVITVPRLLPANGGGSLNPPVVGAEAAAPGQASTGATNLPEIRGVPAAGQQPAPVGTDRGVLHFDVNLAAVNGKDSRWTSGEGYEQVVVATASNEMAIEVVLSADAARIEAVKSTAGWSVQRPDTAPVRSDEAPTVPTTVNGRPATIQKITTNTVPEETYDDTVSWLLRWQPADGLHALVQVFNVDKQLAYAAAGALRLDRTQRCVMPVRLANLTAGATWKQCQVQIRRNAPAGRGVFVSSGITVEQPDGHRVQVWVEDAKTPDHPHDAGWFKPNRTVAGHPAMWMVKGGKGLVVDELGPVGVGVWPGVDRLGKPAPLTEAEAVEMIENLRVVGDLAHPETWPRRAIG